MKNYFSDRGIILGRRDLGEADRLVRIFFLAHGRETIVARGVRKSHAKLRGLLEPGTEAQLECVRANGLPVLTGGRVVVAHADALNSYEALITMQAIAEITERTIAEHNPEPEWYDFFSDALRAIDKSGVSIDTRRLIWIVALAKNLKYLGMSPSFDSRKKYLNIEEGVFDESSGIELTASAIKLWRAACELKLEGLLKIKNTAAAAEELEPHLLAFWLHRTGIEKLKSHQLVSPVNLKNLI